MLDAKCKWAKSLANALALMLKSSWPRRVVVDDRNLALLAPTDQDAVEIVIAHTAVHGEILPAAKRSSSVHLALYRGFVQVAPHRNVEVKARDPWPERSRQLCRVVRARDLGELWQRDTYFFVNRGRLKLREQEPGGPQLIHYLRDDQARERESEYRIATLSEPEPVQSLLAASLGVRVTVTKRRQLFVWERVRIHLDQVEQLGNFIELEAVASEDSDLLYERRVIGQLREAFHISDELLVPDGYADQLLARRA